MNNLKNNLQSLMLNLIVSFPPELEKIVMLILKFDVTYKKTIVFQRN